ncbi:hypothetical protein GCM10011390_07890 [Aureimonas endophytica]|uniref:TadE-like domain-containing protein n=1 Tax=Aureimonas endophytica TaxID=2027858 RepID=A0A917E1B3_9HYPH|nr:TadE/TadG family type IV pilus assembly protein [Aureimonas endophytica]GGD91509.1 hypothetical protein GCM10011390_07890 [Aureimonas endophytica]
MIARFAEDRRAASALEFAFVAPVLMLIVCATANYALALWTKGILDSTAAVAARCGGVASPLCAAPMPGCGGSGVQCYAVEEAKRRGLGSLKAEQVEAGTETGEAATLFRVAIAYDFPFMGTSLALKAEARFPVAAGG